MNNSIPYFPLDVHLDDKIELIEAEFGLKGFAVVVKLFQKIYGGQGYYCEWTKDVSLLFSKQTGLGYNDVSEIVSAAVRRGIFDKTLFDKYSILTSRGVQKRYFEAVSRRKKVEVKREYLLFNVDQIYKNVYILGEDVNISRENASILKQSKGKKSKEEKRTEEESNTAMVLEKIIDVYEKNIAPVTPIIYEGLNNWCKCISGEIIEWAIGEAVRNNKGNYKYIDAILKNHHKAGHKTMSEVTDSNRAFKSQSEFEFNNDKNLNYDDLEKMMMNSM